MSKKLCDKGEQKKSNSKKNNYVCKECGLEADKPKKLCKPQKNK